jgi:DNA repair exonuclease SbcCD ATPase subunit
VGSGGGKSNSFENGLLEWLKQMTHSYTDIDLSNGFKSNSIQDGKAFLALVNEFKSGLIDYKSFKSENREHNLTTAFQIGEEKLNVPSLIDAAELAAGQTPEKNIVLYLSLWHNAWKELHAGVSSADLQKRIKELEEAIRRLTLENEELRKKKQAMKLAHGTLSEKVVVLTEETHAVETARDELSIQLNELKDKYESEKRNAMEQIKNLSQQIKMSSASSDEQRTQLLNQIAAATKDRDALLEELKKLREGLQMENEDMAKKNQVLGKRLVDLKKAREDLENSLCAKQEKQGKLVIALRQKLLQHVNDMHTWKVFLEQDKEYDSEGLHIVMEGVLADLTFKEQVVTLDNAIQEETDILAKLLSEKSDDERNPKPVVVGGDDLKKSARRDDPPQKSARKDRK